MQFFTNTCQTSVNRATADVAILLLSCQFLKFILPAPCLETDKTIEPIGMYESYTINKQIRFIQ